MGALDDLLAKGYAAAAGDEPAPKPAPSMDTDVAALLGRTPASPERTPPAPEGAAADVAALSGKSPAPAPAPGFGERVADAAKYGVNLASTAAEKIGDLTSTEGLRRNPQTGEWEVDPEKADADARPWYKKAAGAVGDVLSEGVVPWAQRKTHEAVEAAPTFAANFANAVTGGTAPALIEGYGNLFHSFKDSPESQRPVHTEAQMQAEAAERNKEHPAGAALGDVAGSAYLSALTGPESGAATVPRLIGSGMNSVGQYLARNITGTDASQPWKTRINQGMQQATEDPVALGLAAATPALAEGAQRGLGALARGTSNAAKDAYSHLFLPASERSLLKETGGDNAVRKLVSEVQDEGILGGLIPTANSVSRRAGQVINKTGPEISAELDKILAASKTAGGTADTTALMKELRDAADNLILNSGRKASDKEVAALEDAIQRIDVRGLPGQKGKMSLERAVKMLKDFQANTRFDPTVQQREPIEQAINMTGWKGLKDATTAGFNDLEQQGHLPAGAVDKYKDLQKSYHTAKTVHYPALKVAEKVAQARGTDPSNLLGAALLGGQFGAPAAIGVSLGGVPHGVSGRLLQGVSGVAKGGSALTELSNKLRIPQGLGGQLAAEAKQSNEEARTEIRERREKLARRARAKNDLEKQLGVKLR